jgi:hypothetical protein
MDNKKVLIGVVIGVVALGGIGFVTYSMRKKALETGSTSVTSGSTEDGDTQGTDSSDKSKTESPVSQTGVGVSVAPDKKGLIDTFKENKPALKEQCGRRILFNGKRKDAWLACIARGGVESSFSGFSGDDFELGETLNDLN